jgi:uncharacterized protein
MGLSSARSDFLSTTASVCLSARRRLIIALLPFALLTPAAGAQDIPRPSFDCAKATTPSENLICRDVELAAQEHEMADSYNAVLRRLPPDQAGGFRREHYKWFEEYRLTCDSSMSDEDRKSCIMRYMGDRIHELQTRLAELRSAHAVSSPAPIPSSQPPSPAHDDSSVESIFPKSFDAGRKYTSYNYDDLVRHVEGSFKVTNTFVGERVKVIALYDAQMPPSLYNRSRISVGDYGCHDPLCDRLELLTSAEALKANLKNLKRAFSHLAPFLYFRDPGQYSTFLQSARKDGMCTTLNPCYVLAAGTLRVATVDYRTVFGIVLHPDIIYIDTDKLALFKSSEYAGTKAMLEGAWSGIKFGAQLYSTLQSGGQ